MTTAQRNAFTNLILLCKRHHQLVDDKANEGLYPVEAAAIVSSLLDAADREPGLDAEAGQRSRWVGPAHA